jgi:hypothetical protein
VRPPRRPTDGAGGPRDNWTLVGADRETPQPAMTDCRRRLVRLAGTSAALAVLVLYCASSSQNPPPGNASLCGGSYSATKSVTPETPRTPTPPPTATGTASSTPTPTSTQTSTSTPTPTSTPTISSAPTETPTPSETPTITSTPTETPTSNANANGNGNGNGTGNANANDNDNDNDENEEPAVVLPSVTLEPAIVTVEPAVSTEAPPLDVEQATPVTVTPAAPAQTPTQAPFQALDRLPRLGDGSTLREHDRAAGRPHLVALDSPAPPVGSPIVREARPETGPAASTTGAVEQASQPERLPITGGGTPIPLAQALFGLVAGGFLRAFSRSRRGAREEPRLQAPLPTTGDGEPALDAEGEAGC